HKQTDTNALISIYGGKITTYRKLAEAVMEKLQSFLPEASRPWTSKLPLPGSQFTGQTLDDIQQEIRKHYPWLTPDEVERFSRSYGVLCFEFLKGKTAHAHMGKYFGAGLFSAEVDYLIAQEWATCADDVLFRRTKLGLFLTDSEQAQVERYVQQKLQKQPIILNSLQP